MATRPVFITTSEQPYYKERTTNFEYFSGFAISQKQKCITSLHNSFISTHPDTNILEISTKSLQPEGVKLSAFNLSFKHSDGQICSVESAFQSSKVFTNGGPYSDLLHKSSLEAKKDHRLRDSGALVSFEYDGKTFPLEPKTFFYDWIYINALAKNPELLSIVSQYNAFTDIEFNPVKSINCQARSAAIASSLYRFGLLDEALSSTEIFCSLIY